MGNLQALLMRAAARDTVEQPGGESNAYLAA
jgi:hypothetical protein